MGIYKDGTFLLAFQDSTCYCTTFSHILDPKIATALQAIPLTSKPSSSKDATLSALNSIHLAGTMGHEIGKLIAVDVGITSDRKILLGGPGRE